MPVNMDSILAKAKKHMETKEMQAEIWKKTDEYMIYGTPTARSMTAVSKTQRPAYEASAKFIEVFRADVTDIASSGMKAADGGMSAEAVEAVSNLDDLKPIRAGNKYYVGVYYDEIENDMHRDSLQPGLYDGVDNIAALLNSGYSAGGIVRGVWRGHNNGKPITSLPHRNGAHFIERAISDFFGNYATEFGVEEIQTDPQYNIRSK